jgi:Mn2+/Fe2+ NRAMP family transporter
LVLTQVLNALLLLPLLVFMFIIARDRSLMGEFTAGRGESAIYLVTMALIALCVGALLILG